MSERGGPPIRRGYVETAEGQLHYREAGSGPPLLLLHQTASSSTMWERVMLRLAGRFRLLALDTPGFGGSDAPLALPEDGLAWYATRVAGFLDALGLARVHVVGHHTGAMIAAELAAAQPQRVQRLVLLGCVVVDANEGRRFLDGVDHWSLDAHGTFVVERLLPRLRLTVTDDDPVFMQQELTAYLQAGPDYWWAYEAVFTCDAQRRMPAISAPTLCAAGSDEIEATRTGTRRAAELIPGARHRELPDAADAMVTQDADRVAPLIADFLDDARG